MKITINSFNFESKDDIAKLVKELKNKGNKSQLLMFLSEQGGPGKIYVILVVQTYCHTFCQCESILYDNTPIYLTGMMGCTVALIKGLTLHSATNF